MMDKLFIIILITINPGFILPQLLPFDARDSIANKQFDWNLSNQNNVFGQRSVINTASRNNFEREVPRLLATKNYDERLSNLIALNVLRFAHDIGIEMNNNFIKCEIFSPTSIMSALALILLGAKDRSYEEINHIFGGQNDVELNESPFKFHEEFGNLLKDIGSDGSISLRSNTNWRNANTNNFRQTSGVKNDPSQESLIVQLANGLFIQKDYKPNRDYVQAVKSVYKSDISNLDFRNNIRESQNHINQWINEKTFGKIPSILNEIPRDTNLIIANALYLKAFWENSFFETATTVDSFYPDGIENAATKVHMMATGGVFPFYDATENNCRIIGLPYKGNTTTFYIIHPYQSTRSKLRELQFSLTPHKIEEMISKMEQKTTVLAFPKMHLIRSNNMKSILKKMNISSIFSSRLSDLSLIAGVDGNYALTPEAFPSSIRETETTQFNLRDRYNESALIFSRDYNNDRILNTGRQQTYRQRKRLIRQSSDVYGSNKYLKTLEKQRKSQNFLKSDLFVQDIFHKVDININEHGTEAAAATLTYLRRSGTDVLFRADSPFLILIRHDPTKMILFYGIINEPDTVI